MAIEETRFMNDEVQDRFVGLGNNCYVVIYWPDKFICLGCSYRNPSPGNWVPEPIELWPYPSATPKILPGLVNSMVKHPWHNKGGEMRSGDRRNRCFRYRGWDELIQFISYVNLMWTDCKHWNQLSVHFVACVRHALAQPTHTVALLQLVLVEPRLNRMLQDDPTWRIACRLKLEAEAWRSDDLLPNLAGWRIDHDLYTMTTLRKTITFLFSWYWIVAHILKWEYLRIILFWHRGKRRHSQFELQIKLRNCRDSCVTRVMHLIREVREQPPLAFDGVCPAKHVEFPVS